MALTKEKVPRRRRKSILPIIGIIIFLLITAAIFSALYLTIQETKRQQGAEDVSNMDKKILDMLDR